MLGAIGLLLVCQLAGEAIHRFLAIPLPGSVIGLAILLVWLAVVRRDQTDLAKVTGWLTAHLSVMFVPAAVGLMEEGAILSRYGLGIVVAVVVSTLLTLAVTAVVFGAVAGREPETDDSGEGAS